MDFIQAEKCLRDIIAGKIANDNTNPTINFYISEAYGPIGSDQAVRLVVDMFSPFRLKNQVCFRSSKALSILEYIGYEEVKWQTK